MKHINCNQASELGLSVRINRETLHPLGLAMKTLALLRDKWLDVPGHESVTWHISLSP